MNLSDERAAQIFEYALTFCEDEARLYDEFRDDIVSLFSFFGMASFDLLRESKSVQGARRQTRQLVRTEAGFVMTVLIGSTTSLKPTTRTGTISILKPAAPQQYWQLVISFILIC